MGELTVRPARPDELTRVGELTVAAYAVHGWVRAGEGYALALADTAGRARDAELLVAVDPGGAIVGTVTVCLPGTPMAEISRPGELEFRMLAVEPAARGRGVGETLVRAVLDRARRLPASRVVLCSRQDMLDARSLYLRLGFRRLPERDFSVPNLLLHAYALELPAV